METPEQLIRRIASQYAFQDPDLLVATARQESGLNPLAVGDRGQSYGVFQEHSAGRGAGIPIPQRQDVAAATQRAIAEFNAIRARNPTVDRGTWAALAQRPQDQQGYARSVNALLGGAPGQPGSLVGQGPALREGEVPEWYRAYQAGASESDLVNRPQSAPPAAAPDWYRSYLQGGGSVTPPRGVVAGAAVSGDGGIPAPSVPRESTPGRAEGAQPGWVQLAASQLGKPYIWGSGSGAGGRGTGDVNRQTGQPNGFDCSGFVSWVYQNALGVEVPAYTGSAYQASTAVGSQGAQPGDLVFWNMGIPDPRRQHVAIYIGDGKVIQSGGQGDGVNIAPVTQMPGAEFRRVAAASRAFGATEPPGSVRPGRPDAPGTVWLQGAVGTAPASTSASAPAAQGAPEWYRRYTESGGR
jgi:cell wall-associated NlpC family hydrolase